MLPMLSRDIDDRVAAATWRAVPWSLAIIALAAAMLLLLGTMNVPVLDRLLPQDQPFLPYFTT